MAPAPPPGCRSPHSGIIVAAGGHDSGHWRSGCAGLVTRVVVTVRERTDTGGCAVLRLSAVGRSALLIPVSSLTWAGRGAAGGVRSAAGAARAVPVRVARSTAGLLP